MFGMPLAKLVSGLRRPDPTPRTVYVTVHDPDDPIAMVQGCRAADEPNLPALIADVAARAGHRARHGGAVVAGRLRRSRRRVVRSARA